MRFVRRHRIGLTIVGLLAEVRVLWHPPGPICEAMTLWECLGVAVLVVAGTAPVAIALRAAFLAAQVRAAVRRLPTTDEPGHLIDWADVTGVRRIAYLAQTDVVVFCAGPMRPRVYISAGALAAFGPDELQAVLAHEAAHARRRDPLRRLLARSAADVLFFVPVVAWWTGRQREQAELSADRAAVRAAGTRAVARALAIAGNGTPAMAAVPAFEGSAQARVAQLLGDPVTHGRPSRATVTLSAAGLVLAVSLAMCVGQGVIAAIGL
jgi:Zn-dependent protease with chaperone function